MPPESVIDPPSVYGPVFIAIERRLRERYHISIKDHLGEVVIPEATGKFDPSMGGAFPSLGGPREKTLPGSVKRGKFWKARQFCKASPFHRVIFNDCSNCFAALPTHGASPLSTITRSSPPPGAVK